MPAAWQASGTLLGSTGADITPVIPTHANGDLLILLGSSRVTTETCATPAGWTVLFGATNTTAWRSYCWYRKAISAAETNPLLDWSAAVGEKYGQVHTIRGADHLRLQGGSLDPFSDSAFAGDVTDSIVTAGCASVVAADHLVIVVGIGSDNASASVVVTDSGGGRTYTQRHFSTITTGSDACGWFHDSTVTGSNQGNITCNFNSTMPAATVLGAAIRPAGFPPPVVMSRACQ
jgi:hypothetical protein